MKRDPAPLEVLQYAMRNERLGHRFYLRAAKIAADEKGRRLFQSIASEEEVHLTILQKEFESLNQAGIWVTLEQARGKELSLSLPALFPEEEAIVEEMIQKRASDLEALDIALDLERRGYELYQEEAKKADNPTARAIYRYLANEENKHFTLLQKTRHYLATNGSWLWDDLEHPQLDG